MVPEIIFNFFYFYFLFRFFISFICTEFEIFWLFKFEFIFDFNSPVTAFLNWEAVTGLIQCLQAFLISLEYSCIVSPAHNMKCWSFCCCSSNDGVFSYYVAVFIDSNVEGSQSSQKASCQCCNWRKFFPVGPIAGKKVPFHHPVLHVSATGSLVRSLMHTPMLITWFEVLCTFVGLHVWSSLKVHCMIIVGVMLVVSFIPSIAFKHAWKGLHQFQNYTGGWWAVIEFWHRIGFPW